MEHSSQNLFGHSQPLEYPDAPGHRGVATSIEAADAMAPKIGRLQRMAIDGIAGQREHGATADELAELLDLDRYSIQPRTSELSRKGLIVDSGLRRRNATGKRAIVWCLPQYKRGRVAGE
jgi:hypothetical protein